MTDTSTRQIVPFAVCGGVGVATLLFPPYFNQGWHIVVAGIFFLVALAVALVAHDTSRWQVAPPLIFFIVIAVARDGTGGSDSWLAPLIVLPVLWVALYGSRVE